MRMAVNKISVRELKMLGLGVLKLSKINKCKKIGGEIYISCIFH